MFWKVESEMLNQAEYTLKAKMSKTLAKMPQVTMIGRLSRKWELKAKGTKKAN